MMLQQAPEQGLDQLPAAEAEPPALGDGVGTVAKPGDAAGDAGGRVGVVAEPDRGRTTRSKSPASTASRAECRQSRT